MLRTINKFRGVSKPLMRAYSVDLQDGFSQKYELSQQKYEKFIKEKTDEFSSNLISSQTSFICGTICAHATTVSSVFIIPTTVYVLFGMFETYDYVMAKDAKNMTFEEWKSDMKKT